MRVFILDDEIYKHRNPIVQILQNKNHELTIATSCEDAKKKYEGDYDLLLLDHDMEGYINTSDIPNCGYQFVLWLVKQQFNEDKLPQVIVHSQNHQGAALMVRALVKDGYKATPYFYSFSFLKWLENIAEIPL